MVRKESERALGMIEVKSRVCSQTSGCIADAALGCIADAALGCIADAALGWGAGPSVPAEKTS